ncbi:MAG: type II 3-dehydroquinate dehydratase [Thermotogae bacterium]|nr:type II 3-dehydroquinate dehydratase [Thermotogota bacterium]
MKILIVNGPNLNMLGKRPKEYYGEDDYQLLVDAIHEWATSKGVKVEVFQSNHEGELVDRIQICDCDGLVINPGALTNYSYAIRDALECVHVPKVEVHISNIYAREEFRKDSITAPLCDGVITGLGVFGYILALEYIFNSQKNSG